MEDPRREELIQLELATSIVRMSDGYNSIVVHTNEESADKVLAWLKEKE